MLKSELAPDGKVAVLSLLQEGTAGERTVPNASRPSGLRPKLRHLREPTVEKDAALSSASRTSYPLDASRSSDDEAVHEAALILFNVKTAKSQIQRQSMVNTFTVDLNAVTSLGNKEGIVGNGIRQYEEHNRMVNAAQTLMSIRHIEPPHSPGAWRNTKFRLLPRDNASVHVSNRATVNSDDGLDISGHAPKDSDDDPADSLLEVRDDRNTFRGNRVVK